MGVDPFLDELSGYIKKNPSARIAGKEAKWIMAG